MCIVTFGRIEWFILLLFGYGIKINSQIHPIIHNFVGFLYPTLLSIVVHVVVNFVVVLPSYYYYYYYYYYTMLKVSSKYGSNVTTVLRVV